MLCSGESLLNTFCSNYSLGRGGRCLAVLLDRRKECHGDQNHHTASTRVLNPFLLPTLSPRMYENQGLPLDAPERFRIEILFSPGVSYDLAAAPPRPDHTFPSVRRVPMQAQVGEDA